MKGKIAFVLGVAVGYVLGTRAGRERYEQIKSGAQSLWNAEPVQRGVHLVRDAVDERVDELKDFAKRVGADVVSSVARQAAGGGSATSTKRSSADSGSADEAAAPTSPKTTGARSAGSKTTKSQAAGKARKAPAAKAEKTEDAAKGGSADAESGGAES